jgi:hypothetical protein
MSRILVSCLQQQPKRYILDRADEKETLFGKSLTPAERLRQHQRSLQKAQRELEREKSKLEAQEKKTMADIKKNAKAGNMVRQPGRRPSISGHGHPPLPSFSCGISTELIPERMQDPSKGFSPYTSIYPEVHPDASSITSRLAQDADVEE